MMKRMLLFTLLALALPMAAFADQVDFSSSGGTLKGCNSGLTLTGSEVIAVSGFGGGGQITGSNLGTLSFSTGAFISTTGNVSTFQGGGSFTITGNGTNGLPNGIIFSGKFTGPVTITLVNASQNEYVIAGGITGTWYNGQTYSGGTSQNFFFTGNNGWWGTATFGSGNTLVGTVPEPGTLALLGTGLVGLAGLLQRKSRT